ncbi:MAG: response regulator [Myxococcota bacterium]|nr:response regulator [Myxococcota bacterium]
MGTKDSSDQRFLTTHQVAKLLGVSLPTVVNWVNAGKLSAHRTPGGHRRIARSDLLRFARDFNYPLSQDFLRELVGTPRILVVDDEADFCEMVRDYLQIKGPFEVQVAHSGFKAGLRVATFKPDLILMDIMMPGMDGFAVLQTLRDSPDTRAIPVIACTAFKDPEIDARIEQEDFSGFVRKPLRLDELLAEIRSQLKLEA